MKRRDFLLASAMLAASTPAAAQRSPATARVGWLAHGDTMPRHFLDEALAGLGWVEGKNLTIQRRFGGSAGEQEGSAAAELVAWGPDVIVALGTIDARPVLALTQAIPIVVVTSANPVAQGLAVSLARPGKNVTGTAAPTVELLPKLLEVTRDLMALPGRVVLGDPRVSAINSPLPASVGEVFFAARDRPTARSVAPRELSTPEPATSLR